MGAGINSGVSSAGVAEHHALVAGALLLVESLAFRHALADVLALLAEGHEDAAGVGVETHRGIGVPDVVNHAAGDGFVVELRRGRDLAGERDKTGFRQGLAGDAAGGVPLEDRVQDGVRDLVAHLVGVTH